MLSFKYRNAGEGQAIFPPNAWIYKVRREDGSASAAKASELGLTMGPGEEHANGQYEIEPNKMTAGRHVWSAMVDPDNQVVESDETNNSTQCAVDLTAGGAPDLVIESVQAKPYTFDPEDSIDLTVVVRNRGAGPAIFSATWFGGSIARCSGFHPFSPEQETRIEPGQAKSLWTVQSDIPPGDYDIACAVDPENLIAESDETNNGASVSFKIALAPVSERTAKPLPDLEIASLTVEPSVFTAGQSASLRVEVRNAGSAAAELPPAAAVACSEGITIDYDGPRRVEVGETKALAQELLRLPPRDYALECRVDPENAVAELNEDNNLAKTSLKVMPLRNESGSPDLAMKSCRTSPGAIASGESASLFVKYENRGAATAGYPAGSTIWRVTVDPGGAVVGGIVEKTPVAVLPRERRSEAAVAFMRPGTLKPGRYRYAATIDPDSKTTDRNRANNVARCDLIVDAAPIPDLKIASAGVEPRIGRGREDFAFRWMIENLGSADARFRRGDKILRCTTKGAQSKILAETIVVVAESDTLIERSGFRVFTLKRGDLPLGSHNLICTVDPDRRIRERNEINNLAVLPLRIRE
jgi:subtilase family serine protease